jgi:hypothetical protein
MTSECLLSGYNGTTGNHIFEHPPVTIDHGTVSLDTSIFGIQPKGVYTSKYSKKNWNVKNDKSEICKIKRISDDWKIQRVIDNQFGYKASQKVHGTPGVPVSHVSVPSTSSSDIKAAEVNIQSATNKYGHAEMPLDLGKNLGSKKVLLRNPGDLLYTSSKVHNGQIIVDPSGRANGLQGIKLKM